MLAQAATALAVAAAALPAQTIAVSGDPGALTVHSAMAGKEPDPASESTTTYALTTTAANQKIVARLDAPLPEGMTLTIRLSAPPGATSLGQVTMTTTDQAIVVDLPAPGTYTGLAIVYTLTARVAAGSVPPLTRAVTLGVADGR
jgi:hypothetical protein